MTRLHFPFFSLTLYLLSAFACAATLHGQEAHPITRICFGSCIKQDQPVPILETILRQQPELFVFLGDNIYADTTDMNLMQQKYGKLKQNAAFSQLLRSCDVLATWDDHDYGANDAGADYPKRVESQQIFLDFWGEPVPEGPASRRLRDRPVRPDGRPGQITLPAGSTGTAQTPVPGL